MLTDFETTLMGMLIDVCGLSPAQITEILEEKARTTDSVATVVTRRGLVSAARLANLIAQYFELPLVEPTFDPSLALEPAEEPIDFILERNLVPTSIDDSDLVVVGDCVPSPEVLGELEELFQREVRLRICDSNALAKALARLRTEVAEVKALGPANCGQNKERFLRFSRAGWSATVTERFAGGMVRYHYSPALASSTGRPAAAILTKTVESLHESEPREMVELLVGKSMSCAVSEEVDLRELVAGLLSGIRHFQGELKEAIFELRLAQLILEDDSASK